MRWRMSLAVLRGPGPRLPRCPPQRDRAGNVPCWQRGLDALLGDLGDTSLPLCRAPVGDFEPLPAALLRVHRREVSLVCSQRVHGC